MKTKEKRIVMGLSISILLFGVIFALIQMPEPVDAVGPDFEIVSAGMTKNQITGRTKITASVVNTGTQKVSGTVYIKFSLFSNGAYQVSKGWDTVVCTIQAPFYNNQVQVSYEWITLSYKCGDVIINPPGDNNHPQCYETNIDNKNIWNVNYKWVPAYTAPINYDIAISNWFDEGEVELNTDFSITPESAADDWDITFTDSSPTLGLDEVAYMTVEIEAVDSENIVPMTITFLTWDSTDTFSQTNECQIDG